MQLQGQRAVNATVAQTWAGLNDPDVLRQCITGCESIESAGANRYQVTLAVKVGPVSARFTGQLRIQDIVPLVSYTILFEGQGGTAGFGKGEAKVSLQPVDGGTTSLTYTSQAHVGGKLAQVGSRLIDSVAAKVADDFFKAFEACMQTQRAADLPTTALSHQTEAGETRPQRFGLSTRGRIALAVSVAGIVLVAWYFRVQDGSGFMK
jgi:uncharacterized protein